jgi:hypothetical protein
MKKSRTLKQSLVALNTQMESAQRDLKQQMGVTPKDLGLPDTGQPNKK